MSAPILQLLLHYLRLIAEVFGKKPPVHDADRLEADNDHDDVMVAPPQLMLPLPPPAVTEELAITTDKPKALASAVIQGGLLMGSKVVQVPSKRHSKYLLGRPIILLWHWTSTSKNTAFTMAKRIQALAKGDQRSGSVHFWIERDGTIYQSVPTNRSSWHAGGKSSARFHKVGDRYVIDPRHRGNLSVNPLSIGVELVCVGSVKLVRPGATAKDAWVAAKAGDRDAVFMGWPYGIVDKETGKVDKGPVVPDNEVRDAVDRDGRRRYYQVYTRAQIEAAERLTRAVVDEYHLDRAACSWGHIDVDPTRKVDPGPLWFSEALPALLTRVLG